MNQDHDKNRVKVFPDLSSLSYGAGEFFVKLASDSVKKKGRFTAALAGGSTPGTLYRLLATSMFQDRIPWDSVHLFWGDERCVPPTHPDSNYRMADETLLSQVAIPPENIHRMQGEAEPRNGASLYEKELREFFRGSRIPVFDLVLLGLGTDGHTASLFPFSDALSARDRLVMLGFSPDANYPRLTLTLSVINSASAVLFLVSGKNKAKVLSQVMNTPSDPDRIPAQGVLPENGKLHWFADEAAASLLKS